MTQPVPFQMNPAAAQAASTMFSGIAAAKAKMDANYEAPGHYLERIDRVKIDVTRDNSAFVAVEKTVIHIYDNDDGKGHKKGEQITHMLMQKHDSFLPNMKAFIAAACSMEAEQITPENAQQVCGVSQPLAGTVVECKNRTIMTKKQQPFTLIIYQREVPPSELLQTMPPADQQQYFPNNALQLMAQLAAGQAQ